MNKLLTYFYCASLLCCVEVNAMQDSILPKVLIRYISSFLPEDDLANSRMVSKCAKKKVDDLYTEKLEIQFGNNTNADLEDLLTDRQEPFPAPFESHYTNKIMTEVCTDYLKDDGYLFVSQGSLLEGYLGQHYKSVPLYDYLKNKEEETKELYKALFGKDLAKGKEILGLKLLTACLPSNHIYVKQATKETEYSQLMAKFQKRLLQSIQGHKTKYFLCGIDDPSTLSDKDVIVINQSDVDLDFVSGLDNSSVPRTIIYNADQEELFFSNPPKCMSNLILVNGDNCCVSIGSDFLRRHEGLQSFDFKGLTSVQKIEKFFLFGCKNLVTFDSKGMTNVQTIGYSFLSNCNNLVTFDSKGLTRLETIGNNFLYFCNNLVTFDSKGLTTVETIGGNFLSKCKNLVTFDSKGMTSVQTIGDEFLSLCENLVTFYSKGMTSVETIGGNFLSRCKNLVTFYSNGMTSVKKIGRSFLSGCEKLVTFDTEGLKSVKTIGDYFLYGSKKLITFDTAGLKSVQTIGDSFLSDCENLVTFYSKGMTSVQKIEKFFLSGSKKLDTFDIEGLKSVQKIGYRFLHGCPKLNGNKIKEEILRKSKF